MDEIEAERVGEMLQLLEDIETGKRPFIDYRHATDKKLQQIAREIRNTLRMYQVAV